MVVAELLDGRITEQSSDRPESDGRFAVLPATKVLVSTQVVLDGAVIPATIVINSDSGKIVRVVEGLMTPTKFPTGTDYTDCSPHVILPGLVDAHVHINDPGRAHWEGFYTGTRAAAAGGVTTIVDMPLNSIPPTTTCANLEKKIRAAQGRCWVDVAFYGGLVPGNKDDLKPLVRAGVRGFKAFLIDSGVEEFPAASEQCVENALLELKDEVTVLLFHAEMAASCSESINRDAHPAHASLISSQGPVSFYKSFLRSRPPSFETRAIKNVLAMAHLAPKLPLHIVHLSTIHAIPLLREARDKGIKVTAETCPHYLSLTAEDVSRGDTLFKCCPPIRTQKNQDGLWLELLREADDSVIRTVVSDHSPCTADLKLQPLTTAQIFDGMKVVDHPDPQNPKAGNFFEAWGGISSIGLLLPILWTEMSNRNLNSDQDRNTALLNVVRWCCFNTASQVGLENRKGRIAPGFDADFCVFDPDEEWVVCQDSLETKNKLSPYIGKMMNGAVRETWVRGSLVYSKYGADNRFAEACIGKLLLEPRCA